MKKKVVFYGNCHTGAVIKNLKTCRAFNEKYEIYPIKEIQNVTDPGYFDLPIFRECDVLIHQSIWEKNRYGKEYASSNIISKVKDDCKVIAMPNLYHLPKCLFPQYYEAAELRFNGNTFFFRDRIIDDGIEKGYTLKRVANSYYDYVFDAEMIRKSYQKFLDVVSTRELEWDIKVRSFIEENIFQHQLFYEPNHPTNYLIRYYAKGILKILLGCDELITSIDDANMDTYQMPLLTEVKSALGLCYSTEGIEIRKTGTKILNVPMDIEQYVNQYFASLWMCQDFDRKTRNESKVYYNLLRAKNKAISIKKRNKL